MIGKPIDPELQVALSALLTAVPDGFNAPKKIEDRRTLINAALALNPVNENVTREDRMIPVEGAPDVRIRIYRPKHATYSLPQPAIFTIHGGGMVTGGGNSTSVSVGPINVSNGDNSLASRLRANIEEVVIKTLREQTR